MGKKKTKKARLYSDIAYDDAFRTMETECNDLLIPFVNYIFKEDYGKDAVVIRMRNEQFIEHGDHSDSKRITDSNFEISQYDVSKKYHLECESKAYDGTILVRFFEYDSQIALSGAEKNYAELKVKIPNSGLFLLREAKNIPERLKIIIETPEGSTSYHVEVIRESDFTVDSIFEKRLYLLIPFYIFNYEKELADINANADRIELMVGLYRDIMSRLDEEHEVGRLSSLSYGVIIRLTHKVIYKFLMKHRNLQEKVGDFMGGKVLELPEIRAFHEGKAAGIKEGNYEAISRMLLSGKTVEEIVDFCGYSVEQVKSVEDQLLVSAE